MITSKDYLIVGAGFAGSVCAERLASSGNKVLVIDRREHIGGNAYDCLDDNGILIHLYGPHIFHTNSRQIFDYISQFTGWNGYQHRVKANIGGSIYPFPINIDTLNKLYGLGLQTGEQVEEYIKSVRENVAPVQTSEDYILSTLGRDLYEKFFHGYTLKQWGLDPSALDASVAARIPYRTDREDRYFTDNYQGIPTDGYCRLFERMLGHENIEIRLGVDYFELQDKVQAGHVIYTGPVDQYFGYSLGKLPYRSIRFEHEYHGGIQDYQVAGTVNYPGSERFTRITEFKKLTRQVCKGTSIVREFPCDEGEPYYPVPRKSNNELYGRYRELTKKQANVTFIGRLAQYRYYNMDQIVGAALTAVEKLQQLK